eukprot:5126674-Ditylum_brightwellii.AAC.1
MDPNTGVATIGGTDHRPQGIGNAQISWKDDDGFSHTYRLKKVLYFPESPVNIISVTLLAEQLNDDEGAYVTTKRKHLIFSWDQEKANLRIEHSQHCLPEIPINAGFSLFKTYYVRFRQYMSDFEYHAHSSNVKKAPILGFDEKIDFEQALSEELDTPISQNDEDHLQSEDI